MSDAPDVTAPEADEAATEPSALDAFASELADKVGAISHATDFDTVRIYVDRDNWVDAILAASEDMPFFSWLSAIDWSKDTEVGEPVDEPDELDERFEVICRMSSVENADGAHFIAALPKDDPTIASLTAGVTAAAGS